jgi:hypothetical protein
MHVRITALLFGAALACNQPQRPQGGLRTLSDLVGAAGSGDADAAAAVVLRGQPIRWLSSPYNAGAQAQEPDRDGLVVQPGFSDARPAAFVTTEIWDGFPRVWAQPMYILVTRFDPVLGPQQLAGALPIFALSAESRFYSPFWQMYYVTVPADLAPDALRSDVQVIASGFPLTLGPLRLCSLGPREIEVAHAAGQVPVHPFAGDVLQPHLSGQAWAEGELAFSFDFGLDRFRINDANFVVQEVAMFRLALSGPDGTPQALDLPPVIGTGPLRAPRAADAPDGFPRFGALRHEYLVTITPRPGDPKPGIFVSASRPALRAALATQLGAGLLPLPSAAAERLPEREQYTLRVALDGTCFGLTDFPASCIWLDTQQSIESNLPVTAFTDLKRFSAGALLLFDGVAP